jgi:hypothetical protein
VLRLDVQKGDVMKTYTRDQILGFLAEVDDLLDEPSTLEIIGGAAALLAYGAHRPTKDIDSFAGLDERIIEAARRAEHRIPLDRAAVADPPYNYEDRLRLLELPFRNLQVVVPDRHDLLLMKAVRAMRNDDEVIQEMHAAEPFDLAILVNRYKTEMGHAIGDRRILDQKIQLILEKLFGRKGIRRFTEGKS